MISRYLAAQIAFAGCFAQAGTTQFGTIKVTQLNGSNNSVGSVLPSVALSMWPGASAPGLLTGGNRGDYNVSFGNTSDFASGVLISSAAQNLRDDSDVGGPAFGPHSSTTAVQLSGGGYYIPTFRSPEGDEANVNTSFVYLPYDQWIGGVALNSENNGPMTSLTASSGLSLGSQFVDPVSSDGIYSLDLDTLVPNASQNGILLVAGAKNEGNYALSSAESDGSFKVYCHDNGSNGSDGENDPVAFAYLPESAVGTNRLVAIGRVNGDGSTDVEAGVFNVTKGGIGQWYLTVEGHNNITGTLIVSPEGGDNHNVDNIVSSDWDAINGRWIIESRDLSAASLQNMGSSLEDAFSFAFFALPGEHGNPPTVSFDSPVDGTVVPNGETIAMAATATDEVSVNRVAFYNGDTWLGSDFSSPYQLDWANAPLGVHSVSAVATNNKGFVSRSSSHEISVIPAPGSGGLYFDGFDDHVAFGNSPVFRLSTFTLECWFRREPGGRGTDTGGLTIIPLIAKGRSASPGCNFMLGIDEQSGTLAVDFCDSATGANHPLSGTTVVSEGVWQHAAATFDGNRLRIYLNGNFESELDTTGLVPRSDSSIIPSLGTAFSAGGVPDGRFLGFMDEVRIWNHARSADDIRSGLNRGLASESGLVARYAMDESSGTIINSSAGAILPGALVSGTARSSGAPFDLDVPPGIVQLHPLDELFDSPRNASLSAVSSDPDSTHLTVRYMGRDASSGSFEDFTVIALPDTQYYSQNTGGDRAAFFSAQTDWIVAERSNLNIAAVIHLGDITQYGDNPATAAGEWANATNAMYRLEDPLTTLLPHGIPYSMNVGNHDQTPIGNADGTTTNFNTYFGVHPVTSVNHFSGKPYYGGTSDPRSADNNYMTFRAGGIDVIVISLEYDTTPDAHDIEWADSLLKAHPTHCGIVISHWMVNTGNPAPFSPLGAALYDGLKDNPNLVLMHGGHVVGEGRRSDYWQGHTIHSLLADYQSRPNGGDGWLRILKFRPSLNRIDIQTYSPSLGIYETDADSQFSLDVDLSGLGKPFEEIGASSGPPGATEVDWSDLATATRYEWYAEVSDGTSTTRSEIRTFVTNGTSFPPVVELSNPENGAVFSSGQPVMLEANASDSDGQVTAVKFYSGTHLLGEATTEPFTFLWNSPDPGSHTLIAKAVDSDGIVSSALPVGIQVQAALPTVSIATTDGTAGEWGGDDSLAFTVTRDGSTIGDLAVSYSLSGVATPGVDFEVLPGSLLIPTGSSTADITSKVIFDRIAEGDESLVVTLSANAAYQIGTPDSAVVTISDSPFGNWLHLGNLGSAMDDDDRDGLANIVEYYMGSGGSDPGQRPSMKATASGEGSFVATFPHAKSSEDVTATLQWSTDLVHWYHSGESDGTRSVEISTEVTSGPEEDPETIEATATITAGSVPRSFHLRLAVSP